MTTAAQVTAALIRNDPDGAALLAAEINDPAEYLAAMVIIHRALQEPAMKATATLTKNVGEPNEESFELEPSAPGHVPARVIDELRGGYRHAKALAGAFSDAIKAQAGKHEVAAGALRRYVVALESDSVEEVEKEMNDLERLIEEGGSE